MGIAMRSLLCSITRLTGLFLEVPPLALLYRYTAFIVFCAGLLEVVASAENPLLAAESPINADRVDFQRDIQPILRAHCYECHAGTTEEGGLNLGVKAKAFRGGDSDPAIVAGKSGESLLIQLVSGTDDQRVMPPEGKPRLGSEQVDLLRAWIDQGASWPDGIDVVDPKLDRAKKHWAYQRLQMVQAPPRQPEDQWSKGPIDRFVRQRLDDVGLRPSQPADARSLVRRLYFDVIGFLSALAWLLPRH